MMMSLVKTAFSLHHMPDKPCCNLYIFYLVCVSFILILLYYSFIEIKDIIPSIERFLKTPIGIHSPSYIHPSQKSLVSNVHHGE
jgi:hypothetical protein